MTSHERGRVLAAVVLLGLGVVAQLATPTLAGRVLDGLAAVPSQSRLSGEFVEMVKATSDGFDASLIRLGLAVTASQVLGGAAYLVLDLVGEDVCLRLRRDVFRALVSEPIATFEGSAHSRMLAQTAGDVDAVRGMLTHETPLLLERGLTVLGGLVAVATLEPRLAAATLIAAPLVAFSLSVAGEALVYPLERISRARLIDLTEAAAETFANARAVKGFGMEAAMEMRFERPLRARYMADRRLKLAEIVFRSGILLCAGLALVAAARFGRASVAAGALLPGDLAAFLVYAVQIAVSLANSTRGLAVVVAGIACAKSTLELLDESARRARDEDELDLTPRVLTEQTPELASSRAWRPKRLDLRDVWFTYPAAPGRDVPVLRGICLTLERSRSVALVGPSGGGKTSVLALIQRFYAPTEGVILVDDDVDLARLSRRAWRRHVGLVAQDPMLFMGSISQNIALGLPDLATTPLNEVRELVERAARAAGLDEFAARLPQGLDTDLGPRCGRLSAGQRQRVSVARALVKDPSVLLLDEHTSQLDAKTERALQASLERVFQGRISLVVAHRLTTAKQADSICVLVAGRVVERGSHQELLSTGGIYAGLWNAQHS